MRISCQFDSGAIDLIDASDPSDIRLAIRRDSHADFRQWFHFRLQGARGRECVLRIENAAACAYPEGWLDYRAVASHDRRQWFRVADTRYDGQTLTIRHTPARDSMYFAYFEPYSHERHLDLMAEMDGRSGVTVSDLGATVEGRDLDLVTVGDPGPGKRRVWIVARQHPGETMAEWFVEGLLRRLTDESDPVAATLLSRACVHVVPNMNPDGAVRGNLRTNAAGANLNREWLNPSLARSPEVYRVREKMHETGVDLFLDIHGDEALPYVFADGCSMLPGFTLRQLQAEQHFLAAFERASPDFQTERGYAPDRFDDELLTLASKYVGHAFGCLSLTLEMPFKDNANRPDPQHGWSAARSARLGADVLYPVVEALVAMG